MMQEEEIIYEASGVIEEVSPEVVEVEIFEAFQAPAAGDEFNHALLTNREIHDAHPITAITGLREELDSIEALQTVYSDKKGNADYYEWADGHAIADTGYFVTLNKDVRTISICTGDDIFGVVVDNAAFVGGQDDITRDEHYGLVATSGAVHVRCELDVAEGDYVVSNAYGVATTSSSGRGYKVVALHDIKGVPHATINLNISADQVDFMGAELRSLGVRMGSAETNIVFAINVANEAHKRSLEAATSSSVSEEAVKDALESILNSEQKIEEFEDIIGSTSATVDQVKAIAESAAVSAASMREEAVKNANETWAKIDELTDDIVAVDDKTEKAMHAIIRNGRELQSLMTVIDKYSVGEYSQANGLTLEQAASILEPGMMYVPTSHENLKDGTKYHEEKYPYTDENGESQTFTRSFIPGYLYQWGELDNGLYGWITVDKNYNSTTEVSADEQSPINTSSMAVYFSEVEVVISSDNKYGYWYTNGQNVVDVNGKTGTYEPYTLYKWEQPEGEEGYWFAVATLAGNSQNRATSMVRQTANEIEAKLTNAYGGVAGWEVEMAESYSTVGSLSAWKNGDGDVGEAIIRQEAKDDGTASIVISTLQKNSDDEVKSSASLVLSARKNSEGTDSFLSIDADNINFESGNFTVKAGNIDFTGHTINIDARDVLGIQSPHFSVDTAGNMTATSGHLADWEISENTLKSGHVGLSSVAATTDNLNPIRIYAGGDTADDAEFKVCDDGSMHSSKGYVADWKIEEGKISSGDTLLISNDLIKYPSLVSDGDSYVRFSAGGTVTTEENKRTWSGSKYIYVPIQESNIIQPDCGLGSLTSLTVYKVQIFNLAAGWGTDGFTDYSYTVDYTNNQFTVTCSSETCTNLLNNENGYSHLLVYYTYECEYLISEARTSPAFKVLADGSLYASAVDISGTIHADAGGQIGPFVLTTDGLNSAFVRINEKEIYFPVQSQLNLNDSVRLYTNTETGDSYLDTVNSRDFVVRNASGAGIKFYKDTESVTNTITLTVSGPSRCNTANDIGAYGDGIDWEGFRDRPSIEFTATLSGPLPFAYSKDVYVKYVSNLNGTYMLADYHTQRFTVKFDPFITNTTVRVYLESYRDQESTFYSPKAENISTGISFSSSVSKTNELSYTVHSYSSTNNVLYSLGNFNPDRDKELSLGANGKAWGNMYLYTGTQVGSDLRLKNTIEALSENYETFFDYLKPVSYILNDGQSGRKHIGFIAQDVERSLSLANIDTKDFAGLCIPREGESYYMLRYEEFIALNTHMIQKLKTRTTELENKVVELTELVKRLDEKLNTQQND